MRGSWVLLRRMHDLHTCAPACMGWYAPPPAHTPFWVGSPCTVGLTAPRSPWRSSVCSPQHLSMRQELKSHKTLARSFMCTLTRPSGPTAPVGAQASCAARVSLLAPLGCAFSIHRARGAYLKHVFRVSAFACTFDLQCPVPCIVVRAASHHCESPETTLPCAVTVDVSSRASVRAARTFTPLGRGAREQCRPLRFFLGCSPRR